MHRALKLEDVAPQIPCCHKTILQHTAFLSLPEPNFFRLQNYDNGVYLIVLVS